MAAQFPTPAAALRPRVEKAAARAKASSAGTRAGRPSLRTVLLDVLKKAGRTLSVQEMAAQAKKAGYRSKSENFKSVIWTALGNMLEVEHDPKGGYRLKNGKA